MQEKIIILDFGSQTTQLIGRRVRELDTYCEIVPYNKFPKEDTTPPVTKTYLTDIVISSSICVTHKCLIKEGKKTVQAGKDFKKSTTSFM